MFSMYFNLTILRNEISMPSLHNNSQWNTIKEPFMT